MGCILFLKSFGSVFIILPVINSISNLSKCVTCSIDKLIGKRSIEEFWNQESLVRIWKCCKIKKGTRVMGGY